MWLLKGIQCSRLSFCHVGEVEKSSLHRKCFCGSSDLSFKAFKCLSHDLIIVKLSAYGFSLLH